METLIYNVHFAGETDNNSWILIRDRFIAAIGRGDTMPQCSNSVNGEGGLILPGVIDCHVHFREPGMTHKADIARESVAAVTGGVTSYFDMPNCKPPTTTLEAWRWKMERAAETSQANYAFYIGATNDNIDELRAADYSAIPGVKLFMGSSTGNMLVDDTDTLERLFRDVDAVIAVHAEDQGIIDVNIAAVREKYGDAPVPVAEHSNIRSAEACYRSTARAVELARKYRHRLHVCHLSTAAELELLTAGNPADKLVTSEVSPHHLLWCDADYATKGTRIKMNPAVKTAADREALRQAVRDGLIDIIATDHAPHLIREKEGDALTAVSGAPLVQFSLALMLSLFDELTVQRTMCENPAMIFGIDRRGRLDIGCYADIVLVHEVEPFTVKDADVLSPCRWTPLNGVQLRHRVCYVWVNGCKGAMPLQFNKK